MDAYLSPPVQRRLQYVLEPSKVIRVRVSHNNVGNVRIGRDLAEGLLEEGHVPRLALPAVDKVFPCASADQVGVCA